MSKKLSDEEKARRKKLRQEKAAEKKAAQADKPKAAPAPKKPKGFERGQRVHIKGVCYRNNAPTQCDTTGTITTVRADGNLVVFTGMGDVVFDPSTKVNTCKLAK